MTVQTDDKKLDGKGLSTLWGIIKNLFDSIVIPKKTSDLTNDSNFVSDSSYVHTDNNYTTNEKNKLAGIASGAEVNVQSDWSATSGDAFIKNKPTIPAAVAVKGNAETEYRTGNVNITPTNIGLGNVGNFKAVSTVASQGLSNTEKTNARDNIGAGTSSFSGSYNDLSNKPTIPAAAANGTYTVKTLVGSTTTNVSDFTANQSSADDVTFVQGTNVTITPDATNRKITIAAKDTTYSSKAAASGGTDVSLVTTGEKYTWNVKQDAIDNYAKIGGGFYTCTTGSWTAGKAISISNFTLITGCCISVLFTNAFLMSKPTLSINSGTAIEMWHAGRRLEYHKVHNNAILTMVYDGTYWQVTNIEDYAASVPSGAVDMGLPSGLLWCEHNVGAATPYDIGQYFSWGNVTGHSKGAGYDFSDANYSSSSGASLTANIGENETYDMVRHNMGAPWRLPTYPEIGELAENCDTEWIDEDGVYGRRFISRSNGNTLFFPATGYYDGTTLKETAKGYYWLNTYYNESSARIYFFTQNGFYTAWTQEKRKGCVVRAVQ